MHVSNKKSAWRAEKTIIPSIKLINCLNIPPSSITHKENPISCVQQISASAMSYDNGIFLDGR